MTEGLSKPINGRSMSQPNYLPLKDKPEVSVSVDNSKQETPPDDKNHRTYLCIVLLGTGVLFPWNVIISAVDFFEDVFPGGDAIFFFSIAYQTTNLLGLLLMMKYGSKFLFKHRIVSGFFICILVMAALPFTPYQWLATILTGIFGLTNALLQGSLFGLVGIYSAKYMSAFMTGQGLSGLAAALLRVLSKGALPQNTEGIRLGSRIFFMVACLVLIFCVLSYHYMLEESPVTTHFASYSSPSIRREFSFRQLKIDGKGSSNVKKMLNYSSESGRLAFIPPQSTFTYLGVLNRIKVMAFTVFGAFYITLALFPGITAELRSTDDSLNLNTGTGWFPLILVTLFNLGDFVGRSLPGMYLSGRRFTIVGGIIRLVFFPLFMLSYLEVGVQSDWYIYVVMLIFSISNGYISTASMIYGTGDDVPNCEKDAAGTLMVFFLSLGLAVGVWFGYALKLVTDELS